MSVCICVCVCVCVCVCIFGWLLGGGSGWGEGSWAVLCTFFHFAITRAASLLNGVFEMAYVGFSSMKIH